MKEKEEQLLNLDILASIIFVGTIIVSIFLTYNEKKNLYNEPLIKNKTAKKINITNRVIASILVITFFYINFSNYKIAKEKGKDLKYFNLQMVASTFTLIASFIVLYIVVSDRATQTSSIENPNI